MKDSARYVKIVEWSNEDQCYVGSSPGLIYGGCHGEDEKAVFDELCRIVEDAVDLYRREGRPLPPPTSGRDLANKMQDVAITSAWSGPASRAAHPGVGQITVCEGGEGRIAYLNRAGFPGDSVT